MQLKHLVWLPLAAMMPGEVAAQDSILPQDVTIDATAGVGFSANPFLFEGEDTESGFVEFTLTPRYTASNARGETILEATYRQTQYFEDYGSSPEFSAAARMNRRLTERSSLQGSLIFNSSILGQGGQVGFDPVGPIDPVDPTEPVVDPGFGNELLIGQRLRQNLIRVDLGYEMKPSERSTVSVRGNAERSAFTDSDNGLSYWSYGLTGEYRRTLSERSSVGGRVSGNFSEYDRDDTNSRIVTPQIFYSTALWETWQVEAALGALFIWSRTDGVTDRSTGLSANLSSCRRGERSQFCLSAYRGASATGVGEPRTETGARVEYSRQLRERDYLRFDARYSRVGGGFTRIPSVFDGSSDIAAAYVTYDRGLSNRLSVGARAGYRDFFGNDLSPRADVSGQLFVKARVGELR